jgi:23S rRNA (cytosine1962-C5)-methyltransferase
MYGAASVLGVDIKEEWLNLARENAKLNGTGERVKFVKGEAFTVLKDINASGGKFDIIILDPPSFLKTRESLISAAKGYKELNTLAMKSLSAGGVLATFSCSHNMHNELFARIIKDAAAEAGKKMTILKRCHQAEDHPIVRAVPETEYLKGYFLKDIE